MSAEEWRPIPGFPGYEVSDLGRVRSFRSWRGQCGPRLLAGGTSGVYRTLSLRSAGTVRKFYVHHLVAEAFHGPRSEGQVIRHLDGNELNNAASNLLYGTPSENSLDTVRHGTNAWLHEEHCRNGHLRTAENTRYLPKQRLCRDCLRIWEAARRQAKRAARAAA